MGIATRSEVFDMSWAGPYQYDIGKWLDTQQPAADVAFDEQITTLLCLSLLRWNSVQQRPQHLMSRVGRMLLLRGGRIVEDGPPMEPRNRGGESDAQRSGGGADLIDVRTRRRRGDDRITDARAVDGVEQISAFRRIEAYPLIVQIGLGRDAWLAAWRSWRDASLV